MKYFKKYNIVVVGAGASGMMAAITAAKSGVSVALIEHTNRVGSKILSTGNGKCNFTNLFMDKSCFQNADKEYVFNIINQFNETDTIDFFKKIGIYPKERNGYVYPHSETAASVQDALSNAVSHMGVDVVMECKISDISLQNDNTYVLRTGKGNIGADRVILATGSKAFSKSGSDGSGYELAAKLGHKIKKPLPALVSLKSDFKYCKVYAGVRSTGSISLFVEDECVANDTGEIQYADYGISGIPVFQISRYAVEALDRKKKVKAVIDMLGDFSLEELQKDYENRFINEFNSGQNYKTLAQFYSGLLNVKLVNAMAKSVNIDPNLSMNRIRKDDIYKFLKVLKNAEFTITGSKDCDSAQVCQGGVRIKDLYDTLESKISKGLYFAGELIDVDGKCGGYNLQWAWSSGFVAAVNAVKSL